ncbi:MAG: DNA-directed RNA polymerase subunit omega [Ignavibacteriaceae bacterium]|nr:DNA-directed RNA polymerase subunit omega [Ignavibacteriaceae bacterium]
MGVEPVDLREIDKKAANVYEAIVAAAKKSRILNDEQRLEFKKRVESLGDPNKDDDGEDLTNPEQARISVEFERRDKPHIQALKQLLDGDFEFKYKDSK